MNPTPTTQPATKELNAQSPEAWAVVVSDTKPDAFADLKVALAALAAAHAAAKGKA